MSTENFNVKLRELYNSYIEVLKMGDAEKALETGVKVLEELLILARRNILESIVNPTVKEIAVEILLHYEKELSFIKGAREAVRSMPPLYTATVADRALENLSSCINGLFNFAVGALLVMADVLLYADHQTFS